MAAIDRAYVINNIEPYIFIGSWQSSSDYENLTEEKIKVILSLEVNKKPDYMLSKYEESDILSYEIHIDNTQEENMERWFPRIYAIISHFVKQGVNILVHCGDGYSRAVVAVASYILTRSYINKKSDAVWKKPIADDILKYVIDKRRHANPSMHFISQLRMFETHILSNDYDVTKLAALQHHKK